MIALKKRIDLLVHLGNYLNSQSAELDDIIETAHYHNAWFTKENIRFALKGIAEEFLDSEKLIRWLQQYQCRDEFRLKIGLILAGNLPAVGFHDVLCSFLCGHKTLIKLAEKDHILIPHFIDKITGFDKDASHYFEFVTILKNFDAVIATGSNNSSIYFESYFAKYPHIIRKNRNGVAILDGKETSGDFIKLGRDIFSFFGLGCRNVAKIYVPRNYDFKHLLNEFLAFKDIAFHNKYKNNFDYNIALFLLNKIKYLENGILILIEDAGFASRIASCHFEYYDHLETLKTDLENNREYIQCIVGNVKFEHLPCFELGEAQNPSLYDFADGVDTMSFLTGLNEMVK